MKTFNVLIKEGAKVVSVKIEGFTKEDVKEVVLSRLSNTETLLKIC